MRLLCRECSATYEAPDNLFGAQPREVRCNRCGFQWTVVGAVKAVPGAGPQPVMASPEAAAAAGGIPPEFMRGPAIPPAAPPVAPTVSDPVSPPAVSATAAPVVPAKTSVLADNLAGPLPSRMSSRMPDPLAAGPVVVEPVVAPPSPSTRSLLARGETEAEIPMGDPEERRLSHELSFGETERAPVAHRASRGLWRGLWLVVMLIVVLGIAAILFEPQILSAVPALGHLYAVIGL
jgi:predicted Zn finger-like uncharacterized protein